MVANGRVWEGPLEVSPVLVEGRAIGVVVIVPRAGPRASSAPGQKAAATHRDPFARLHGADPALRATVDKAARLACTPLPLLLLAETGTGKERLARAIHEASGRAAGPFVALNCAALTGELLAAELFGYAPGAFTGAHRAGREGKLEAARGGTLFLDEIADMPASLQALLLRVLEDGSYFRVGESVERRADARILCATCRDLQEAVAAGRFRSDLYYRVRGAILTLPPLRLRDDLRLVVDALLPEIAEELGLDAVQVDASAWTPLLDHAWPGNVRELRAVLLEAAALGSGRVRASDLALEHPGPDPVEGLGFGRTPDARGGMRAVQVAAVRRVLDEVGGNVSAAARRLGVARSTIYRMLRRHRRAGDARA